MANSLIASLQTRSGLLSFLASFGAPTPNLSKEEEEGVRKYFNDAFEEGRSLGRFFRGQAPQPTLKPDLFRCYSLRPQCSLPSCSKSLVNHQTIRKCQRCFTALYCNRKHEREHLKAHKNFCTELVLLSVAPVLEEYQSKEVGLAKVPAISQFSAALIALVVDYL